MELKSVKKIVNILSRDLASVGMRVHNLHEHESSHIAMQPFESWPLRRSTKKTYSEVTACKPYTVTRNHFQLLDNHQENNSPVDVLNKSTQPWKDYSSASRVRSAHVKSEHQMMKDIGKTLLRNANFHSPDVKNNLAIPVIVKGQAHTSTIILAKKHNSKSTHRKDHKVLIMGDSHT